MPKTASASVLPWTCAMPQSSRVMVTRLASARHRTRSGGDAAVRRKRSGARAAAVLRIRQGLLRHAPIRKRLRGRALEELVSIADAEMMAAVVAIEFFPGHWSRDRRTFAGPGRIGHDGGRTALVPQPVEEDPPLALHLADVGGEGLRFRFGDSAAETVGEALHRRPVLRSIERHDDVDSLAARKQREALEAKVLEKRLQAHRRGFHLLEIQPDVGVEVEHQAVGIFDLVNLAAPAMELDRSHLHRGKQPADVVEIQIILSLSVLLLDWDLLHVRSERALVVLL